MNQEVQVNFFTKSEKYSVPSNPITLTRSCSGDHLNKLLKKLLKESGQIKKSVDFVFLISGEVLTGTLHDHLNEKQNLAEIIDIEYCEKQKPPEFEKQIEQKDFISCVKRCGKYILTGSYDGMVYVWSIDQEKPLLSLELDEKVKCVDWIGLDSKSDRGIFVTGGFNQSAQIWSWCRNKNEVQCIAICRGHSETVMTAAASTLSEDDGFAKYFATGSWDGTTKLWSAALKSDDLSRETGGIIHLRKSSSKIPIRIPLLTLAGHRETITKVCWLPTSLTNSSGTNQLISVSWDHSLRIWDIEASSREQYGKEIRCIVSNHALHDADSSVQGILVGSSDNCIRIYDHRAENALVMSGFQGHTGWLTAVAWAPHRQDQFITGSIDRSIRLWDTRNPRASLYNLMGHTDMVTDIDWSSPVEIKAQSVHYFLSSSADATVKVYRYQE